MALSFTTLLLYLLLSFTLPLLICSANIVNSKTIVYCDNHIHFIFNVDSWELHFKISGEMSFLIVEGKYVLEYDSLFLCLVLLFLTVVQLSSFGR